jgi:hypothetical protein
VDERRAITKRIMARWLIKKAKVLEMSEKNTSANRVRVENAGNRKMEFERSEKACLKRR